MKHTVLAAGLLAWSALASGATGTVYVPARPVEVTQPEVPQDGGGWVNVNFIVQADGTVADVIIVDSSGTPALEKSVIDAVSARKYEPAKLNGTPVAQRVNDRLVVLKATKNTEASARKFQAVLVHASELIDAGKHEAAELELVTARDEADLTYDAWGRIHLLLARVDAARGDKFGQMENLLNALPYSTPWEAAGMLRTLFRLQIELRMYRWALSTYGALRSLGPSATNDEIERIAGELQKFVDSSEGFRVPGEIRKTGQGTGNGRWIYEILRRRIAFADIDGVLDTFEVRCASHVFSDKVDTEREWNLPATWGDCALLVFGQPGSRFSLLELPRAGP